MDHLVRRNIATVSAAERTLPPELSGARSVGASHTTPH
jgi:hypothetical protein